MFYFLEMAPLFCQLLSARLDLFAQLRKFFFPILRLQTLPNDVFLLSSNYVHRDHDVQRVVDATSKVLLRNMSKKCRLIYKNPKTKRNRTLSRADVSSSSSASDSVHTSATSSFATCEKNNFSFNKSSSKQVEKNSNSPHYIGSPASDEAYRRPYYCTYGALCHLFWKLASSWLCAAAIAQKSRN